MTTGTLIDTTDETGAPSTSSDPAESLPEGRNLSRSNGPETKAAPSSFVQLALSAAKGPPSRLTIGLVTPAPARSRKGNGVTAARWARLLRELGHRVFVEQDYSGRRCDVLIALHARRSHAAIVRFRRERPDAPLILALTGTDLYGDIHTDPEAQQSLDLATRFVLLQPHGMGELPAHLRHKARVIYQSLSTPAGILRRPPAPRRDGFEVCVIGHLRPVKDPFRTALAARLLPAGSRIQVVHLGAALEPAMEQQACAETATNPRYRWLGNRPRWQALRVLARSRLMALTSLMEGGANVVTEAIAVGTPVISSRISGSIGLLGEDYPGYFPVQDTPALAALLHRVESDPEFYEMLRAWCARLTPLIDPRREQESWAQLLSEVCER